MLGGKRTRIPDCNGLLSVGEAHLISAFLDFTSGTLTKGKASRDKGSHYIEQQSAHSVQVNHSTTVQLVKLPKTNTGSVVVTKLPWFEPR